VTEGRPIIEPQIVLDIFSCIRELLELHEAFLQRLVTRLGNLSAFRANTIADIFLLHVCALSLSLFRSLVTAFFVLCSFFVLLLIAFVDYVSDRQSFCCCTPST
jgi:hypothetical protein